MKDWADCVLTWFVFMVGGLLVLPVVFVWHGIKESVDFLVWLHGAAVMTAPSRQPPSTPESGSGTGGGT